MKTPKNAVEWSHFFIESFVKNYDVAVDLTLGNGHDFLFLLERFQKVYGFDIQKVALEKTADRLKDKNVEKEYYMILDGHENLNEYVEEKIDALIMNLGYLPSGDKSIITKWDSTKKALENGLEKLNVGGFFLVVLYKGHPGSEEESQGLENYLQQLDQKEFTVHKISCCNQRNTPPELYGIERIKG
ncbi:class I SAM-dependent methyltransferase [Peptoniphilus sp. KCTC 25270]|uniref:tRNA (mnm(5)s(2)U34)-methyltransferase n=1 Tax=Peptoniphilus sp. KCTC 25270 TaxID=2897414 RepID=UPI001E331B94|nr:class I SAM-dependent methyltransferase [Peptoniphilus sp. KCTC 25270]MCD1147136.1 class I SAM-dependent methyltransferase [Peptoniphilus sp. KCTC 25270]